MPLMDALRSGVDLSNAMQQGIITGAQARYAYPMTLAELEQRRLANTYQGIINQYQPEKSRLTNEGMGLANTYQGIYNQYAPDKFRLENEQAQENLKFTPLKYAIDAQNSMRNSSRFGGAYQYLKSVADLPAEQRSIWLANPDNYAQYQQEIQNLHASMSNEQASGGAGSIITPALLKKVGLSPLTSDIVSAQDQSQGPNNTVVGKNITGGLASPLPQAQSMNQGTPPVVVNVGAGMPQAQPGNSQAMAGGLSAPLPGITPLGGMPPQPQFSPPAVPGIQNAPVAPMRPQIAPNAPGSSQALPVNTPPLTNESAAVAQKDNVAPQEANTVANDSKNPTLSPQEKQQLGFQMIANKKSVDPYTTRRALAAVTYEKVLGENQENIAPALENAAKYSGLIGQGKLTLQQFQQDKPKEYQDYMWVTKDLVPNLTNNVRLMEGLAATDSQREALNDMYYSVLSYKSDPKTAINNINKTIKLFSGQAKAALETAQPIYPGTLEKLYGLNLDKQGDYVGEGRKSGDISKMSTEDLLKMYQGAK